MIGRKVSVSVEFDLRPLETVRKAVNVQL